MKRILLFVICMVTMYTTSQAQVCDGPLTVEIQGAESDTPLSAEEAAVNQPSCAGPTGSIEIDIEGGTPDYTIVWNKDDVFFSNDEDLFDIGSGVYAVTITDESGCSMELGPWTIEEPSDISVEGDVVNSDCNVEGADPMGSITLTVSGGTGDYTYAWSTDDGTDVSAETGASVSSLGAGTYVVAVTDEADCTKEESFTITAPDLLEVSLASVDPACSADNGDADGTIDATVSGGTGDYSYAWSSDDGTDVSAETGASLSGLAAGTYVVVVTDDNNCEVTAEVTLESGDPILVTVAMDDPTCHADNGSGDGSITLTVSGGDGSFSIDWSSDTDATLTADATSQTGLTAGTYTAIITDGNGCSVTEEIVLEGPDAIAIDYDSVSPGCFGAEDGSITLNSITGGAGSSMSDYDLTWTTTDGSGLVPGATTQTGLDAGNYTLVIEDANDCSATFEFEITSPSEIAVVDVTTQPSCHADSGDPDGSIALEVTGGSGSYTYEWSTADGTDVSGETGSSVSGLGAGTYEVEVSDGTGCSTTEEFILVEPAVVAIGHTVIPPDCAGDNGSIWTAVSGGVGSAPEDYTYTWTTTDGSGLVDGAIHQQNVGPGSYALTVSDANGCSNMAEFTIESATEVEAVVNVVDEIACFGSTGQVSVEAAGGAGSFTYSLNDSDFQESPVFGTLSAGDHTITVKDANGCEVEVDFTLEEPAQLTAGTCTVVQDLCQVSEGEIKVEVSGGVAPYQVTYTSSNGGTLNEASGQEITDDGGSFTFTGAQGGKSYSFIVTDANGCMIP